MFTDRARIFVRGELQKLNIMKNIKLKIAGFVILTLVIAMTISDWYYSRLENEYPVLYDKMAIRGVVKHSKVHWKHTYVSLETNVKVNIPPPIKEGETDFYDLLETGDFLYKEAGSNKITLVKKDKEYYFRSDVK
jgi:hypothetical protein